MSKKTLTRRKGNKWCRFEVELENDRLSICGSYGRVQTRAASKREALEHWRIYFEENPGEVMSINQRFNKRFTSATGAAKFVLETDGEIHGVDVVASVDKDDFVMEGGGQCVDELREWFPEFAQYLPYHLNDLKASCEHQEAEGWDKRPIDPSKPLDAYGKHYPGQSRDSWNMLVWVRPDEFKGGLLTVPCPTCGYKYGSAWLKRELPPEVRAWAENFPGDVKE